MIQFMTDIRRSNYAAIAAGLLAGLAAAMPAAAAPPNATVTVNATVLGVCKFTTTTATVTISNGGAGTTIDPSLLNGDATGTATLDYKCTKGRTPGFTLNPTSPTSVVCSTSGTCGTESMPVTLTLSAVSPGAGFGAAAQTVTVTGTITQANYENASEGTYTRNVTVQITP